MYLKHSFNMYFSLKRVSYPKWTLIYGGVYNSVPIKTDWGTNYIYSDFWMTHWPGNIYAVPKKQTGGLKSLNLNEKVRGCVSRSRVFLQSHVRCREGERGAAPPQAGGRRRRGPHLDVWEDVHRAVPHCGQSDGGGRCTGSQVGHRVLESQ